MSFFAGLANTKVGDIKPPVMIPVGHYQAQITGQFKEHKARTSGNVAARFPFRLIAPGDNVDASALAEALGDKGLGDKEHTIDFWMSPDALYRFTNFASAVFEVPADAGLMEALETVGTAGTPFLIEVKHEPDQKDPTRIYLRFDNPAPLS